MSQPRLVCGFHAVDALLQRHPERILLIQYAVERRDQRLKALLGAAVEHGIATQAQHAARLDRMAGAKTHQGVVAQARWPRVYGEAELMELLGNLSHSPLILALDGVQDPHNLGACLRVAEALGVNAVVVPRHQAVGLNATVCKAASGAADLVPVAEVSNLARALDGLKSAGCWSVGAAADADTDCAAWDLTAPTVLVLGGEAKGLRRQTREKCDVLVRIPMSGATASLNVSVAAGILIYEAVRQRHPDRQP